MLTQPLKYVFKIPPHPSNLSLPMPLLLLLLTEKVYKKFQILNPCLSSLWLSMETMKFPSLSIAKHNKILIIRTLLILLLSCATIRVDFCSSSVQSSLKEIPVQGNFSFSENEFAARDYGNQFHFLPLAVLHPKSDSDIALTIRHIWRLGPLSKLTVAARGHGHSTRGQAQADQGIVVNMRSLDGPKMLVNTGELPYVDVSAGELWINILHESLKYGLAPKTWTDYLHLTVGGTLSNGGISGQAFRHGPQINNVYQLEVVTGKGEVINCSEKQNADLFHGVLGGLGQFGIITRARISLEPAPKMVKWIRVLYYDFSTFSRDQEFLISTQNTFDYIEGLVYINRTDVLNNWKLSFSPQDPVAASKFISDGRTLYCLELTKNFNPDKADKVNQEIESILSQLSYIPSTLFMSDVSYIEFLDRVHTSELKLRSKGLWDVPHPWLNLLIPRSKIKDFAQGVFGNILKSTNNGPVLIYPVNKSKWDNRTSIVLPEEDIFYMVAILFHATPSSTETDGLEYFLTLNKRILDFCEVAHLGVKQYLGLYTTQEQWQTHFGQRWEVFVQRKLAYDPLGILAPGQRIFQKGISIL